MDGLLSGFDEKYEVHEVFFSVSKLSAEIPLHIQGY